MGFSIKTLAHNPDQRDILNAALADMTVLLADITAAQVDLAASKTKYDLSVADLAALRTKYNLTITDVSRAQVAILGIAAKLDSDATTATKTYGSGVGALALTGAACAAFGGAVAPTLTSSAPAALTTVA